MLPKYKIQFGTRFSKHGVTSHYTTDDPVACEEFLEELLDRGFAISSIEHEGVDLPKADFDRMIKNAAAMMASKRVCASLGIKPEEERFRFGFAA